MIRVDTSQTTPDSLPRSHWPSIHWFHDDAIPTNRCDCGPQFGSDLSQRPPFGRPYDVLETLPLPSDGAAHFCRCRTCEQHFVIFLEG